MDMDKNSNTTNDIVDKLRGIADKLDRWQPLLPITTRLELMGIVDDLSSISSFVVKQNAKMNMLEMLRGQDTADIRYWRTAAFDRLKAMGEIQRLAIAAQAQLEQLAPQLILARSLIEAEEKRKAQPQPNQQNTPAPAPESAAPTQNLFGLDLNQRHWYEDIAQRLLDGNHITSIEHAFYNLCLRAAPPTANSELPVPIVNFLASCKVLTCDPPGDIGGEIIKLMSNSIAALSAGGFNDAARKAVDAKFLELLKRYMNDDVANKLYAANKFKLQETCDDDEDSL